MSVNQHINLTIIAAIVTFFGNPLVYAQDMVEVGGQGTTCVE